MAGSTGGIYRKRRQLRRRRRGRHRGERRNGRRWRTRRQWCPACRPVDAAAMVRVVWRPVEAAAMARVGGDRRKRRQRLRRRLRHGGSERRRVARALREGAVVEARRAVTAVVRAVPGGRECGGGSDTCPVRPPPGTACAVLPLGDSITEGCCTAPEGGYRIELFRQAV